MRYASGSLIPTKTYRILCVEDDVSGRQLLKDWLELQGYEVVCMPDGRQFLQILADVSPDLLLLDLKLPYVDGFTVLEQLQQSAWESIPVIVLSAYSLKRERERAINLGCRHYLVKPTPLETLQALIQSELPEADESSAV